MIEPIVGFLMCGLVMLLTRIYVARFHTDVPPHPEFERWVAERPVVLALQCEPGRAVDVVYRLRAALGKGEYFNGAGGYPWQHYIVTFAVRSIGDDVVGLEVAHARLGRPNEQRPSLNALFDRLGALVAGDTRALWMHGKLKRPGIRPVADREKMGWTGHFDAAGDMELAPMIGQPTWVSAQALAA
jgi:hypothetical protein